jgi:hypothetical protein
MLNREQTVEERDATEAQFLTDSRVQNKKGLLFSKPNLFMLLYTKYHRPTLQVSMMMDVYI